MKGFVDQERRPAIRWLVCADGDAATQIIKCMNQAGIEVPESVRSTRSDVDDSYAARDQEAHAAAVSAFNLATDSAAVSMHLLPFDLEFALTSGMPKDRARGLGAGIGVAAGTGEELAHRLGSKCRLEAAKGASKADVTRREVARHCKWDDLAPAFQHSVERWLLPVLRSPDLLKEVPGVL